MSFSLTRPHRGRRTAGSASPSSRGSASSRDAARRRLFTPPRGPAALGVPAFIALCYCLYTAFITGDNGWSTGGSWLIALVSAGVLGVLCLAVGRWQHGRQPESVAVAYGALFGAAVAFLVSLTGWSVYRACALGVLLAAAMAAGVFYLVHTRLHTTGKPPLPHEWPRRGRPEVPAGRQRGAVERREPGEPGGQGEPVRGERAERAERAESTESGE